MTQNQTVFVIDDDPAVRDSLRWLIESLQHPVETFESAQDFLDNYASDRSGCLLLDVRLPGMSGLQLQSKLKEMQVDIPVIIITGHGDVPMAVRALQAGAMHFLEKPFRDQELLDSVQEALELDQRKRGHQALRQSILDHIEKLTPREYEIMKDIVRGNTNKAIGAKHGISVKTVEVHRTRVMSKMEADSLPELVRMVLTVEPDES
ncbi:MAG TPA: response regulator transcription factor [Gammaproteobacteria bacterium]|nr:response regulator transcription factor [Gammaproteobacteria bacterium]